MLSTLSTEILKQKKTEFEHLLKYLTEKYGTPIITEKSYSSYYIYYQWNTNDRLIHIASEYDDIEYLNKLGVETSNVKGLFSNDSLSLKLFIVNKEMIDSISIADLYANGWNHIK